MYQLEGLIESKKTKFWSSIEDMYIKFQRHNILCILPMASIASLNEVLLKEYENKSRTFTQKK
jgi:hypothetical protein